MAAEIFSRIANGCGHRQIAMCLRAEEGAVIADKTVLKMMREMGIRCGIRRETAYHGYNSYRGVVGRTFENVIARDFDAGAPWRKLGTDVTEFKVAGGKAYWAPTLDFCTKEIVASDISTTPDMAQQVRMLDELLSKIPEGAAPTMHSDRGWQYQHVSVNIFFTIFTNVFSPIAPTRMRRFRRLGSLLLPVLTADGYVLQAVRPSRYLDHRAMAAKPVGHRRGRDVAAEHVAPPTHRHVGRDDGRPL